MKSSLNIAFIPLDNRPVSYCLPEQVASMCDKINFFISPRNLLGGLEFESNILAILKWLETTFKENKIDFLICSLDTIAYGGLIPSRRSSDKESEITERLNLLRNLIQNYKNNKHNNLKVFTFSSIMRISDNNINEEEKEYWNEWGKLLFKYSYLKHKMKYEKSEFDEIELSNTHNEIPQNILEDYLKTRKRNFEINKNYLDWIENNIFDFLVFSKDDSGKYGINIEEGDILSELIQEKNLSESTFIQTGADEIPLTLLARTVIEKNNFKVSIHPQYSTPTGKNVFSRYEDRTIENSVNKQIELCKANIVSSEENADLTLLVHTPERIQNDHALMIYPEPENKNAIENCLNIIKKSKKPILLADIAFANGADNELIKEILKINDFDLYSFSAWNTTGNTIGSTLAIGIIRYFAEKNKCRNVNNVIKVLFTRLVDDWAYQSLVRQKIRIIEQIPSQSLLESGLMPFINNLSRKMGLPLNKVELLFPLKRSFEVEIKIK